MHASAENKPNDLEKGKRRKKKKVESKRKIGRNKGGSFHEGRKMGGKGGAKINSRQYVERFLYVSGYES